MNGNAVADLVLGLVLVALVGGAVFTQFRSVSRFRVERFARRQSLPITVGNGRVVIGYLATTRRWRTGGLLVGIVVSVLYTWARGAVGLNVLGLFAGWFVGAVVAEWRITSVAPEGRRRALVAPRRVAEYLSRRMRLVVGAVWVAVAGYDLAGIGYAVATGRGLSWVLLGWLAIILASGSAILLVARHVLTRPQRFAAADVLEADDAVRSRSLHVLAGSALALAGYLASGVEAHLATYTSWLTDGAAAPIGVITILIAPVLGVLVATATAPMRVRPAEVTSAT